STTRSGALSTSTRSTASFAWTLPRAGPMPAPSRPRCSSPLGPSARAWGAPSELTQQVAHHGSESFRGQAVGLLVGMAVHRVDPERRARLAAEDRQQVVVRDPLLQAEPGDRLVRGSEGVGALEGDEERPGGHEEAGALTGGLPVH